MNLVLGTANFNKPYGRNECKADGVMLADRALRLGITMMDVSSNYGSYLDLIGFPDLALSFQYIYKVSTPDQLVSALESKNVYAIMAHGYKAWQELGHMMANLIPSNIKIGASLYDPKDLENTIPSVLQIVEFPINMVDQRWVKYLPSLRLRRVETVARSIFLHGTLFDTEWKGYPLGVYSLNMVRANPLIDRIIVGAENPKELETIVNYPELEVNYEHLSNPRSKKWLKPITKQVLPLFGEGHGTRNDNKANEKEQVHRPDNSGDNTEGEGQGGDTLSPEA